METHRAIMIICKDSRVGSKRAGMFVTFVVIDGNPVENTSVMYMIPAHIIKGGKEIR